MKIHTTGATASWTLGTSTRLTASEAHGTGAATGTLGTTTEHGHILHGDTVRGTTILGTTAAGTTTHGITEVGMTRGTTEDSGASAHGTDGTLITQDGTADGMTLIGDITSDRVISRDTITGAQAIIPTKTTSHVYIKAQGTVQARTGCLQEQVLFAAEAL